MGKIIEFKNLNFKYDKLNGFNDFNMDIDEGDIVTLIGPGGSGKTTLLKMLCHQLPNDCCYFNGRPFSSYDPNILKKLIAIVFDLPFDKNTIKDEILSNLNKIGLNREETKERYEEIYSLFELDRIMDKEQKNLSYSDSYLIKILKYLIMQPKFLAVDNILDNVDEKYKIRVFDYVKKHNITFLNVTSDLNNALYGNKVYVLEKFVLILEGNTLSVLKTDTLLRRLGFKLPLIADLSIELNHYDLIKKVYVDRDKLVKALWK